MDYSQARAIVLESFPHKKVVRLFESDLCWNFTLAELGETYITNIPGNVSYAVDKETGEVFPLFPGSDAFWKYMPDLKKVPVPEE
ncbi:hypothetical protein [Alloscardovia macacae]|uniref:Uncharacterized protein n=1 Tax=Alloscardovia macacae TaxID=1160091 RepID=A0A261F4T3_9BIFI|nr:hypothetical protein [Alloscardovia macacae]OZG54114.1 hypothetical protein ALMA_0575 [Alloscardovia macacae]